MDDRVYDMNLVLFLGSGVSHPAGMPMVDKLTKAVMDPDWAGSPFETSPILPETLIKKFLRRLYVHHDLFLRAQNTSWKRPNYEDLFHLCNQIHRVLNGLGSSEAWDFVKRIEQEAAYLISDANLLCNPTPADLASAGESHTEQVVRRMLSRKTQTNPDGKAKGFDLLREILARVDVEPTGDELEITTLNIITLNHDLLMEKVLEEEGQTASVDYTDGFDSPDRKYRWYEPNSFFAEGRKNVSLIKLHGSINWYSQRIPTGPIEKVPSGHAQDSISRYMICPETDVECREKAEGGEPHFLTGMNKELIYNSGIFADMYEAFLDALRQSNRIVMSGFGWNDVGVSLVLKNWLERNIENKIILLHENPGEKVRFGTRGLWTEEYDKFVERGQLITDIKKWFCDTSLDDLMPHIKPSP